MKKSFLKSFAASVSVAVAGAGQVAPAVSAVAPNDDASHSVVRPNSIPQFSAEELLLRLPGQAAQQIAGHVSHSSHVSHASHCSSSTYPCS